MSLKTAATYRLQTGDLLFIRVNGAREIVGRCCVVGPEVPDDTIFNDQLIRVRLKPGLDPEFARPCASLPAARARIEEAAATSAGQLTIGQQVLEGLEVPCLDMEQQLRIVSRLKAQLADVEVARRAAAAQLAQIDQLPQKLLAQAFDDNHAPR